MDAMYVMAGALCGALAGGIVIGLGLWVAFRCGLHEGLDIDHEQHGDKYKASGSRPPIPEKISGPSIPKRVSDPEIWDRRSDGDE